MINFSNVKQWNILDKEVAEARLNGVVVWRKPDARLYTPFYVENTTTSMEQLKIFKDISSSGSTVSRAPDITIEYSTDNINWNTLGSTRGTSYSYPLTLSIAAKTKVYLRSVVSAWCVYYSKSSSYPNESGYYYNVITGVDTVGGNIMSLIYGGNYVNKYSLNKENLFGFLFESSSVVSAKELILPAKNISNGCYRDMFRFCYSLKYAPESLPATTLADACYALMFYDCTALTTAPELPATTLAEHCYDSMFEVCTSLTTAPELLAPTLVSGCYREMFNGCSKLSYIKCLAENPSQTEPPYLEAVDDWVAGVSSTGKFIRKSGVLWPRGNDGIPSGWTVEV